MKPPAPQLERAEETCNKFTEGTEYKINSIVGNNNDKNYSFCAKHFLKASFLWEEGNIAMASMGCYLISVILKIRISLNPMKSD